MSTVDAFFDLSEFEHKTTLKDYLGKNFKKETAYTIRCGGKNSPIDDRHNWDGYWVDDNNLVSIINTRLSIVDVNNKFKVPLISNSQNSILTYNGEIYNYKDLYNYLTSIDLE